MNSLTRGSLVLVFMGCCILGGNGITESRNQELYLQGILSMMGMSCTPSVVRDCTIESNSSAIPFQLLRLTNVVLPCLRSIANFSTTMKSEFSAAQSSNGYRPFVKKYCDISVKATECMKNAINRSRNCLCELEIEVMMLSPHAIDSLKNFFCADQGVRLAEFLENDGIAFWAETHRNDTKRCAESVHIQSAFISTKIISTSLPVHLRERYNQMQSFKECLTEFGEGHTATMDYVKATLDAHLSVMRCVNGTDLENLVLCQDQET